MDAELLQPDPPTEGGGGGGLHVHCEGEMQHIQQLRVAVRRSQSECADITKCCFLVKNGGGKKKIYFNV